MKVENIKTLSKHFHADCKCFSLSVALGRLVRDIPYLSWARRRSFYEKTILDYLDKKYGALIQNHMSEETIPVENPTIWVMWWQGISQMPPIVRACYDQLKAVSKYRVVLITKDNYDSWVNIPSFIINNVTCKNISLTHLSDIIRAALLSQYGGLWLDATIFVDNIPDYVFRYEIFTLHNPGMLPDFISRGAWSPFLLGTNRINHKFFCLLNILFYNYWQEHNALIDYLLVDYFLYLILVYNPDLDSILQSLPINKNYYDLNLCINDEYKCERAIEMLGVSPFQKLTYKKEFLDIDIHGNITNYRAIVLGRFGNE